MNFLRRLTNLLRLMLSLSFRLAFYVNFLCFYSFIVHKFRLKNMKQKANDRASVKNEWNKAKKKMVYLLAWKQAFDNTVNAVLCSCRLHTIHIYFQQFFFSYHFHIHLFLWVLVTISLNWLSSIRDRLVVAINISSIFVEKYSLSSCIFVSR